MLRCGKKEKRQIESEIKHKGCRESVSATAQVLTGCLTMSVTKLAFSKDRMLLCQITMYRNYKIPALIYIMAKGEHT